MKLAMHGRMNKKEQMSHCAYGHIGRAMESRKGKERQRDLIVVTFVGASSERIL